MNDDIPEEKCFYEFRLTGVSEGGILSAASSTANITVVASDLPYGRFAFSQEQLRVSEEAQRVESEMLKIGNTGVCFFLVVIFKTCFLVLLKFSPTDSFPPDYFDLSFPYFHKSIYNFNIILVN